MTAERDALTEAEARLRQHDDDGYCGPGCPDGDRLRAVVESLRQKARAEAAEAEVERLTRENFNLLADLKGRTGDWVQRMRQAEESRRLLSQAHGLLDCRQMPKGCPTDDPCLECLVAADIEAHLGGEK